MRFFRFPYAGRDRQTREQVADLGYQSSFWDIDPRGWDTTVSAQDIVDAVEERVQPGGIVIMHCSSRDDALALPGVIRVICKHDLTPGMLSSVLQPKGRDVPRYQIKPGS